MSRSYRLLFPLVSVLLLLQGCKDHEGMYESFAGTLPRFELATEAGAIVTPAQSLFITSLRRECPKQDQKQYQQF